MRDTGAVDSVELVACMSDKRDWSHRLLARLRPPQRRVIDNKAGSKSDLWPRLSSCKSTIQWKYNLIKVKKTVSNDSLRS